MDLSSDDSDDYDFGSSDDHIESDDDIEMSIDPAQRSGGSSGYELIKREKVYELMNSVLGELVKITQISFVS